MEQLDMEMTSRKTAHHAQPLVYGNWILTPDPVLPGRYTVDEALQEGGTRLRGYLEVDVQKNSMVSLKRIGEGLDRFDLPTIHC